MFSHETPIVRARPDLTPPDQPGRRGLQRDGHVLVDLGFGSSLATGRYPVTQLRPCPPAHFLLARLWHHREIAEKLATPLDA